MTASTPVQNLPEIEVLLHDEFGEQKPSEEQVVTFLEKKSIPRNDGGISIAIAVAALLLQGWSVYREEQKRKNQSPPPPPPPGNPVPSPQPPICPVKDCGLEPALTLNTGEYICMNGHKWKAN
jgi:hypothetical protein